LASECLVRSAKPQGQPTGDLAEGENGVPGTRGEDDNENPGWRQTPGNASVTDDRTVGFDPMPGAHSRFDDDDYEDRAQSMHSRLNPPLFGSALSVSHITRK
jgi:hypothetical protein